MEIGPHGHRDQGHLIPALERSQLDQLFSLSGRVAIVTGGTRGIGRSIAEGFVAAGASVVVASRKPEACRETEEHLTAIGGEAFGVATHMGDLEDVATLARVTAERYGRIDVIVNNAANALTQPVGEFTPEGWQKSLDVNLRGPVFLVQEALPFLKASGHGSVINVLTAGVFLFAQSQAIYVAGKAALMSLTRAMAAEYAPYNIRVNALAPGTTDTDMVRNTGPESVAAMTESSHLRRLAHPDEMVGPALLLASDAGSYITGQVLLVDGGLAAN
jgi:NAD(P)-dependent dehydrogenase (short-subunit alcohol dehydrogenase family)